MGAVEKRTDLAVHLFWIARLVLDLYGIRLGKPIVGIAFHAIPSLMGRAHESGYCYAIPSQLNPYCWVRAALSETDPLVSNTLVESVSEGGNAGSDFFSKCEFSPT